MNLLSKFLNKSFFRRLSYFMEDNKIYKKMETMEKLSINSMFKE
jgi:hypothetical protein